MMSRFRGWSIGLLLTLVCITASAGTLEEVKQQGVLRVAVYKDFSPYSYLAKGTMQGIDVDIARALAEQLGVGLSTMNLTASDEAMEDDLRNAIWKGHYLGGGTADVMMHVPVDAAFAEENDQVVIFGPYFREEMALARNLGRIPRMDTLVVFTREKIAVEVETIADMYLSRAVGGRLLDNVVHYRLVSDACEALKSDAVSAFMAPRAQLEDCIGDQSDRFAISQVPGAQVGLFSWTIGLAVKSGHTSLAEALAQAMQTIRDDGTLKSIFAEHGVSYLEPVDQLTAQVEVAE